MVHLEALGGNRERRYLVVEGVNMTTERAQAAARAAAVRQEIWLDPLGTDALFAASMPLAFEVDQSLRGRGPLERNDEVRLAHDGPLHYLAWSRIEPPPAEELARAWSVRPDEQPGDDVYLQVPPEITPATRALALRITAGATSDHDKAIRLRDWLHANLAYTTDLRDPRGREPIDYFLFERRAGHCEYFASAYAILGRIAGLRTRSVNGFLGGEWNEYDGYVAVRAGDAHSWTEVYFEGHGWITFDATPPGEADRLGRGGTGWQAKLGRWFDTLRFQWSKWVIDYDLYQQLSLFRTIGKQLSGGARSVTSSGRAIERWAKRNAAVLIGGALTIALGLLAWRLRRRRRGGGDRVRPLVARERTELARLYERAAKRLAPRPPATTPRELARGLRAKDAPGADALDELTELYYAGQWGGALDDAALARARVLADDIEAAAKRRPAKA
jgi:protein-glutamine gamma-glutamyltransferase